ncbi:MAG: hypothetical protein ABIO00_02395 [Candidatus Paceibacterota bacterium]
MKKVYEVLVLLGLAYIAYFVFATVTGNAAITTLLFKTMDMFGAGVTTIGMGVLTVGFIILSFWNITWIPLLAREKRIGALSLHILGTLIAVVLVVVMGLAIFSL